MFDLAQQIGQQEAGARRELKFAVARADLGKIRSVLLTNLRHVGRHHPVSFVRSIYFDDDSLGGYFDSIEGVGKRRKIRLRWYNDGDRNGRLFFEVKRRAFDLVVKERATIETRVPLDALSYREIETHLASALAARHRELLRLQSRPIVLIEYRREYFEGVDQAVRVTLDSALKWFAQLGKERVSWRFPITLRHLVILEIKTRPDYPLDVDQLLYPLRLAPTRCSKYVIGCQQLGLAAATRGSLI